MEATHKAVKVDNSAVKRFLKCCTHRCMVRGCKNHGDVRMSLWHGKKRANTILICPKHAAQVVSELYDAGGITKATATMNVTAELEL